MKKGNTYQFSFNSFKKIIQVDFHLQIGVKIKLFCFNSQIDFQIEIGFILKLFGVMAADSQTI